MPTKSVSLLINLIMTNTPTFNSFFSPIVKAEYKEDSLKAFQQHSIMNLFYRTQYILQE